jgi:hypothetical protein
MEPTSSVSLGGNLACEEAEEHLSALLDVRQGYRPPSDHPLASPAMRASVELHALTCSSCQKKLEEFEAIGLAFSEYEVDEKPVQAFADAAARVRAALGVEEPVAPRLSLVQRPVAAEPKRATWWNYLAMPVASAAVAALVAVVMLPLAQGPRLMDPEVVKEAAHAPDVKASHPEYGGSEEPVFTPFQPLQARLDQQNGGDASAVPLFVPATTPVVRPDEPAAKPSEESVDHDAQQVALERLLQQTKFRQLEKDLITLGAKEFYAKDGRRCLIGGKFLVAPSLKKPAAAAEEVPNPPGLYVYDVIPGSPLYQAGLRRGSYLMALNDIQFTRGDVADVNKLGRALLLLNDGQTAHVEFAQGFSQGWMMRSATVTLGEYETVDATTPLHD